MVCRRMFCLIRVLPDRSYLLRLISKKLRDAPRALDSPLEVEIADDRTISSTRVYQDRVLNVLG